ncbi:T9SS type A sorting domain-containing protein [Flavobacterium sp.]|uniref:T9SS type A sorting domain-containing protein n=1 Tax=Flavobacterium sp. TaxID=239 RepID=UPI003750BA33
MNILYKNFKIQLILAVVLLSASFGFAQQLTVTVPAGCRVVVPGFGGIAGLAGKVGDGGVVSMPDPFPFNVFTANPATGVTVGTWTLLGDLSVKNVTLPLYNTPIVSSTGLQVSIQSYNKTLRISENQLPDLDPIWGRSKGRVRVTYSATCGGAITFEVFKVYPPNAILPAQPRNVPKIVGNTTCLLPSRQYTFSVDQIASDNANDAIGFDSYYWSGLPTGATVDYYSADFSSITFTTSSLAIPPQSILKCCYGRVNPAWDGGVSNSVPNGSTIQNHDTCVSILLRPAATQPTPYSTTLTGSGLTAIPGTNCLPTSQNTFTINFSPLSGVSYVWSIVSGVGWNLTQTATSITVSGIDNNPGQLKLTVNNGCTPTDFLYQINRSFVAPSMAITPANACVLAGSTTSFTTNGLANGTNWGLSPAVSGAIITPSTVGSTMTLFLPTTTAVGEYTVTANGNTSGTYLTCGGSITTKIYVKPVAPSIPSGATCVVRNGGSAQTYTCGAVTGATDYLWSFPSGWVTGNATVTTATPTVTITPNGNTASGTVSVVALGFAGSGCNSASSPTLTINYSVVAPAFTEKPSCYNVNMSSLVTLNVTNAPSPFFGAYTVTLTPTGTSTTPASLPNYAVGSSVAFTSTPTPTITFNTTDTLANLISNPTVVSPPPGVYDLWITFNTQTSGGTCASTASTKIQITIPPANAATLGVNYSPGAFGSDSYFVNGVSPTTYTFVWRIGGVVLLGANNNTIVLAGNNGLSGRVTVDVTPQPATLGACSTITRLISPSGATHGLKQTPPIKITKNLDGIVVYPNPSTESFTIALENVKQSAIATLSDLNGKQLAVYLLKKGETKIENEGLAKGSYILSINIDGVSQSKKIIIK